MIEESGFLVGVDLNNDYTQLTYFSDKSLVPESVKKEGMDYLIPTRLALRQNHEWIVGEDVESIGEVEEIVEVSDFLKRVMRGEKIRILDTEYEPGNLLQIYIRRILMLLKTYYPYKNISYLSFTLQNITKDVVKLISDCMNRLEVDNKKYSILSYDEAFLYYTINQESDLWMNDTAVFELEEDGLHFRLLNIDSSKRPMIAKIHRREVTDKLNKTIVNKDRKMAGEIFRNLAAMALDGTIVSTVYALGRGFIDSWADEALKKLSPGRRVFRGQNLYAKGAAYEARNKFEKIPYEVIFLGDDRTTVSILIRAIKDGIYREVVVVSPAMKWYETNLYTDIIVRGEEELEFEFKDFLTKKSSKKFLSLSGLLDGKIFTRIRLHFKFIDRNSLIIKAADLGFGCFTPTTNRVWELRWEK